MNSFIVNTETLAAAPRTIEFKTSSTSANGGWLQALRQA
eukprot:COSAG05_NODE_207_length_14113_cov_13.452119_8_plen_39_part_00